MRPDVGAAVVRCVECRGYEYAGAPQCHRCLRLVDDIVEEEWRRFFLDWQSEPAPEVARLVAAEPDRHDWRVVDAALDRIVCDECGNRLGRGPMDCAGCNLAHGFRYAAMETDRPGVPPGNEHAIRVNVSVIRHTLGGLGARAAGSQTPAARLAGRLPTDHHASPANQHPDQIRPHPGASHPRSR
jgi:hypothetical protein